MKEQIFAQQRLENWISRPAVRMHETMVIGDQGEVQSGVMHDIHVHEMMDVSLTGGRRPGKSIEVNNFSGLQMFGFKADGLFRFGVACQSISSM